MEIPLIDAYIHITGSISKDVIRSLFIVPVASKLSKALMHAITIYAPGVVRSSRRGDGRVWSLKNKGNS